MHHVELDVEALTKTFGLRSVLSNVSFSARAGDRICVTGRNGSGKSTLLKILAGAAERTSGTMRYRVGDVKTLNEPPLEHVGFVAPYLQLYTEFTAWEHVSMMQRMRDLPFDAERSLMLFELFGLDRRRHDELHTFSSGMMQRVKYICALVHSPALLFLDEPMSNFDDDAAAVARSLILECSDASIVVIATNDAPDLALATHVLSVESSRYAAASLAL